MKTALNALFDAAERGKRKYVDRGTAPICARCRHNRNGECSKADARPWVVRLASDISYSECAHNGGRP